MRGALPATGVVVALMLAAGLLVPTIGRASESLAADEVEATSAPPACVPKVSSTGTDTVLTFDDTVSGGCTWTVPAWVTAVRVLVVAGGGGGGYGWSGSGGGAGGMQEVLSYSVTPGQTVAVTVGQGGAGGTGHDDTTAAKSGGNSVFGPIVSAGGGGGSDYRTPCVGAQDGGSGGGGTGWGYPVGDPQYCRAGLGAVKSWPDAIDDTQGSRGSHYQTAYGGGGGGGAGGQPTGAPVDGEGWNGGVGRASTITGTSTLYAGGGGGGGGWYSASNVPGNGGAGGGGKGAHVCCGDAGYAAIAGTDALGGGGGGGSGARPGARGGSGVVIVRFPKGTQSIAASAMPNPVLAGRQATLSASGFLGTGAITYAVASGGGNCSVSGAVLTTLAVGACSVTATIAEDHNFLSATSAPLPITVLLRYPQSISVAATPNPVRVNLQSSLSASGYQGTGAITYAVVSGGSNCSISGSTLSALQAGTCTVTATIAQDDTYTAATSSPLTVTVSPRLSQSIRAIATPASLYVPGTVALSADGYSGTGAVTFSLASGAGVCSISGATMTVRAAGSCQVRASIAQDDTYAAATSTAVTVTGSNPPTAPDPPYLEHTGSGNGWVTLRIGRPDWDGMSPVTQYRVYSPPHGQVCSVPASTSFWVSCRVSGLVNGQPYGFFATAVNDVGESLPSRRVTATPLAEVPSPPEFTEVRSGHRQATLTWGRSPRDGGAEVTEYRLYGGPSSPVSGWRLLCSVPASSGPPYSCAFPDLKNGQEYTFYATAVNAAGESSRSKQARLVPAMQPPGKPRNLAVTVDWGTVVVTWDAPDDSGTLPITDYEVILDWSQRNRPVLVKWGQPTILRFPGVAPGTTVTPMVRARSDVGWGPYAVARVPTTIPAPPEPKIGYPEIRRDRTDPDVVTVTGNTQGIRPGTQLYVWVNRGDAEDFAGWVSSGQGAGRPVVREDGTFVWQRRARMSSIWEVIWCTGPNKTGACSPWMLLFDPTM